MYKHNKAFSGKIEQFELLNSIGLYEIFNFSKHAEFYNTINSNSVNNNYILTKNLEDFDALLHNESNYNLVFRDLNEKKINNEIDRIKSYVNPNLKKLNTKVCAFSSQPKSGIGYHADKSPVAIVQLKGQKHWKVWKKSSIPISELKLYNGTGNYHLKNNKSKPYIDIILNPNEFLWIPAYFPHMAVSPDNISSLSISIIWDLISIYDIINEIMKYRKIPLPPILYKSYFSNIFERIPIYNIPDLKKELRNKIEDIGKTINIILTENQKNKSINNLILNKYGEN